MLTLRQTRDLVQASQQGLADASGVEVHLITKIELGSVKRPAHELVVKVVRGLRKLGMAGITADQIDEFYVPDEAEAASQRAAKVG